MQNAEWITLILSEPDKTMAKIYMDYAEGAIKWTKSEYNLNDEEANEVFQAAIVVLYDNVVSGKLTELNASLKTYLFAIIKNKIIQLNRIKSKNTNFSAFDLLKDQSDEEYEEIEQNYFVKAKQSLVNLGDPCKSILELFYYFEKSIDEITQLLDYKNNDTTKNLKYKCLKRLQKEFFV
jgi:RNA polymerase sigma factor (sigma-70 family)